MARPRSSGRHAFAGDAAGSVAVPAVLASALLFGMAAVTIDSGRFYLAKRQQQTATDLAAMAAAANLANAQAAAAAALAANGVPAAALASVELGSYAADPAVAAGQRFTPGGASPNAARVTLASMPPTLLGAFVGAATLKVGTRSVALNANTAAFALGSTLANVDGGLANAILSGLTGSTVTLSAASYAGLAGANVDLFGIANALAVRIGATGTYASLAATTVRLADLLNAVADAAAAGGAPATAIGALRGMAAAIGPSGPSLSFGSLVNVGPYGALALGSPAPVAAALPVLPLVAAAARLGAGTAEVSAGLGASGATILGGSVKIVAGGPTAGSSYAAVGPVGTTLQTAQVRMLLTLQLAQLGIVTGLNLPLYVAVAPATATISAIGCSAGAPTDPAVTLAVTPGAVDAWIGSVTDRALTDTTTAVSPGSAVLTNLLLVSVSGRAHATLSNMGASAEPFTQADIAAGTMKSTATTDYTASVLSSLFGNLQLSASVLGLATSVPPGTAAAIQTLLQADLQAVDGEVSRTLALLGITIGDADTWVRAVRCGQGVLVN